MIVLLVIDGAADRSDLKKLQSRLFDSFADSMPRVGDI
jgi:hypothetical protein